MTDSQMTFNSNEGDDPTNPGQEPAQAPSMGNRDPGTGEQGGEELNRDEIERIRKQNQHAQDHIKRLEDEAKAYRDMIADYEAKTKESETVEELLARMREKDNAASSARNEEPTAPVVDVDKLVDTATNQALERLSQREREETERNNFNTAAEELKKTYGEKMNDIVQQRAQELNLPIEKLDELARTSPSALVELVRGKGASGAGGAQPSQGGVTGIPGGQRDDLSYYARLRKEDVNAFYSPEVQKEYRKAIIEKAKKEGRL